MKIIHNTHSPVQEKLNKFIEVQSAKQFTMHEPIHYLSRQLDVAEPEEVADDGYIAPVGLINHFELRGSLDAYCCCNQYYNSWKHCLVKQFCGYRSSYMN